MDESGEGHRPAEIEAAKYRQAKDRLGKVAAQLGVEGNTLFVNQANWFTDRHTDLIVEAAEALKSEDPTKITRLMKEIKQRAGEVEGAQDPTEGQVAGKAISLRKSLAIFATDAVKEKYRYGAGEDLPTATSSKGDEIAIPQLIDGTVQSLVKNPIA